MGRVGSVIIRGIKIGGTAPRVLIAGPCSVESEEMAHAIATRVAAAGATFLRGGAYKPRTSPRDFQGFGTPALAWLRSAADVCGLGVVTEVMSERDVDAVAAVADIIQVGSRNAQNFALLREVGATKRPVLLKRGPSMTLREWRGSVDHLRAAGAVDVLLCERGSRTYETEYRNALDVCAIAILASEGYPVIADPSHSSGHRALVLPVLRAGLAAGACGAIVEVHHNPSAALSDGPQALMFDDLPALSLAMRYQAPTWG